MDVIIITGLSCSGKSTAIHAFEDKGMFCSDNLPVVLLPEMVRIMREKKQGGGIVAGIDIREGEFLERFSEVRRRLIADGHNVRIIYLEARDEVLIRRFSETRRRHPLGDMDIPQAVRHERELLAPLRAEANDCIDTSSMNVHQLKQHVVKHIDPHHSGKRLVVTLLSFGFKYGVPLESDLLFDLRFLPNPYFVPELKTRTGLDLPVREYVFKHPDATEMLERIEGMLNFLIPLYENEGKAYLTVAVGCTGGRHRSVAFAHVLKQYMDEKMPGFQAFVRHRDAEKG